MTANEKLEIITNLIKAESDRLNALTHRSDLDEGMRIAFQSLLSTIEKMEDSDK